MVTAPIDEPRPEPGVQDLEIASDSVADAPLNRRLEQARRVLLVSLGVLAVVAAWLLYEGGIGLPDLVLAVALVALVLALYVMYATSTALTRNRLEREASIRRIVSGLSRSLSPESVVDTVINDLRAATDADHVVVARVSQPDMNVEVTLVAAQADAPPSRTTLRPEIDGPGTLPGEAHGDGHDEGLGNIAVAGDEPARKARHRNDDTAKAEEHLCPVMEGIELAFHDPHGRLQVIVAHGEDAGGLRLAGQEVGIWVFAFHCGCRSFIPL